MAHSLADLPRPVREALRSLGREARKLDAEVLLFGSFAKGQARRTSDIDLAFRGRGWEDRTTRARLSEAIDALPTIRPIDAVDWRLANPSLRRKIEAEGLPLDGADPQ